MDPKEGFEDLCNTTEPEDETLAVQRKRSRRVSFADITSVHVFDRDEDLETPPDSKPGSELAESAREGDSGVHNGSGSESASGHDSIVGEGVVAGHDHGDDDENDEDEDEDVREPFVRSMDFSSPGSTVGSAASNDEENFFGPVSTSFIRPGRLSTESATTDDNHDVTMDSTAFSLHFRSLMQSDERFNNSEGNFKTPTGVHLAFEERTPTGDNVPTNAGSFMVLTGAKKLIPQSMSDEKSSAGGGSNDMILIVDNPSKYDYGRLSPSLDALLTEGQKDLQPLSAVNQMIQISISNSPTSPNTGNKFLTFSERRSELTDQKNSGNLKEHSLEVDTTPAKVPFNGNSMSCDLGSDYSAVNIDQINYGDRSPVTKATLLNTGATGHKKQTQSQNQSGKGMLSSMGKEPCKDTPEAGQYLVGSVGKVGILSSLNKNFLTDVVMEHDHGPASYVKDRTENDYYFSQSSPLHVTKIPTFPSNSMERSAVSEKGIRYTTDDGRHADQDPQAPSPESVRSLQGKRQKLFRDTGISLSNNLERSGVSLKGRNSPDDGRNAHQDPQAPSPESLCSLHSKRQGLFHDAGVSFSSKWMSSPLVNEHPHSPLIKENIRHVGSISSIKNNISKFKLCETKEVESFKPSLLDFADKPCLFEDILDENIEYPRPKPVNVVVTGVEGHPLDAAEKNKSLEMGVEMHASSRETSKKLIISRDNEDNKAILHDEEYRKQAVSSNISNGQSSKMIVASLSSFEVSGLEKDRELQPLDFPNPTEGIMSTPLPPSPQLQTTAKQKGINQVAVTPNNLISSPVKRSEEKIFASGRLKGILLTTSNQQRLSDNLVATSPRQQMQDTTTGANGGLLKTIAEGILESRSLFKENREYSTMTLNDTNSSELRSFGKRKEREYKQSFDHNMQKERDPIGSYQTPLSNRVALNFHSLGEDKNFQRKMDQANLGELFLPEEQLKDSSCESAMEISKEVTPRAQSGKSSLEGVVQSAHGKEAYRLTDGDGLQSLSLKDPVSPVVHHDLREHVIGTGSQSLHILRGSLFSRDLDGFGSISNREISSVVKEQINDTSRSNKSPRVVAEEEGIDSRFHSEDQIVISNEVDKIDGEASQEHWSDVLSKFSAATEQLLPTSIDKLSTQEIGILEDTLGELQKAKKFEKLCAEIKFQKTHDHPSEIQQRRVVEVTWLQHMLVYERAKLQLLKVKRNRLLKNVQDLKSGIQECRIIQSAVLQNHMPGNIDVQNRERHAQSLPTEPHSENQDAHHRLARMRKEHGVLDHKLEKVIKYFHSSCKLKGDPSYDETIALVNDHLQKQNRCMLLRHYLQFWVLDGIGRMDDCRNIVLNYHGLISQRFITNDGVVSSIDSLNLLNEAKIRKSFPHMEAFTAFEFVLRAKNGNWLDSPKNFLQVTETTSFLLGNLLDVIEEVQVARMELPNLISVSFQSPCVGLLELQLCFIDFKSGRKVTLILDMSGLKCAIYPSEILPSQLRIQTSQAQTKSVLLSQIFDGVKGLKGGQHSTIFQLCRTVSRVVEASTQ